MNYEKNFIWKWLLFQLNLSACTAEMFAQPRTGENVSIVGAWELKPCIWSLHSFLFNFRFLCVEKMIERKNPSWEIVQYLFAPSERWRDSYCAWESNKTQAFMIVSIEFHIDSHDEHKESFELRTLTSALDKKKQTNAKPSRDFNFVFLFIVSCIKLWCRHNVQVCLFYQDHWNRGISQTKINRSLELSNGHVHGVFANRNRLEGGKLQNRYVKDTWRVFFHFFWIRVSIWL